MRKVLLVAMLMMLSCFAVAEDNQVVMGDGYQKNQVSSNPIQYTIPEGWHSDEAASKKYGLWDVLVQDGCTIETAKRVITIAFQLKDADNAGLATLENFFKVDMMNTLGRYPDAQLTRWQPERLNPEEISFMSVMIFSENKDSDLNPHRCVFIDSGDGYFSVTATDQTVADLENPAFQALFNSLCFKPVGDVEK